MIVGVAIGDLLQAERDGAQARAAELVEAPGGLLLRDAGGHGGLAGGVLALAGGEDLAEDHLVDLAAGDLGARQRRLDGGGAEFMGGRVGEGAVEGADRRARRATMTMSVMEFHSLVEAAQRRFGVLASICGPARASPSMRTQRQAAMRRSMCVRPSRDCTKMFSRPRKALSLARRGDVGCHWRDAGPRTRRACWHGEGERADAIKKYANRRLYHTGTSTYVTLEDLGAMVQAGEDFVVFDAKTGEDITRSVLTQIIFEQENKGQNLLPITFLRQLIRFYGDSMQALVPSYLEFSIDNLTRDQQKLREQMTQQIATGWGKTPWAPGSFGALEDQARNNMVVFEKAFRMFSPFAQIAKDAEAAAAMAAGNGEAAARPAAGQKDGDIDELKKELADMKSRLDRITEPKR